MRQDNRKRIPLVALVLITLLPTCSATADDEREKCRWDVDLAASYQQFLSPFSAADTMAALQMMSVDSFIATVKNGDPPLVLDVRTPGETGILGFTLPGSLAVPMDLVFTPEVLAKLAGRKVVVVCMAGHRATAVALGLRHVGLDDVWILKGGTVALAAHLNPKAAN